MKRLTALLTALLMLVVMVGAGTTALAADKVFVDEMAMDYPLVLDRSEKTGCEFNPDLETGLYGKIDTIKTTEWFSWKIDGDISGFKLRIQCVNGLGNPEEVKFEVSKDGKNWTVVPHNYTKLAFDDEIYVTYDKAYWVYSDLTNKGTIPAGSKYIRISLLPYSHKDSAAWNIELDKLEVSYKQGSTAPVEKPSEEKPIAPVEPSSQAPVEESTEAPVEESTEAPVEESTEAPVEEESTEAPVEESTEAPADIEQSQAEKPAGNNLLWLWITLGVVVAAGIAVVVVLLVKGGKKPTDVQ